MRWKSLGCLGVMVGMAWASAAAALDGEPVVGASLGAAVPISDFQHSANVGGSVAAFGGYRLNLGQGFALSVLGEPLLAEFPPSACQPKLGKTCNADTDDAFGVFALTFGPRLSLIDGPMEVFAAFQGGWYRYTNGPLTGNAGGENIRAGLNYEFQRGSSVGALMRWDNTNLTSVTGSTQSAQFLLFGLSLEHQFLPPPPVVAEAAPPLAPPPPPPPLKKKVVLRGVNFDFNKSVIRADARPVLDEAIATLKQDGEITVAVEGYTDNIGTEAYNQKLSERRARAVYDYLVAGGIAPGRMTAKGFDASNPVASNETAEGRAQNRRVELRVIAGP